MRPLVRVQYRPPGRAAERRPQKNATIGIRPVRIDPQRAGPRLQARRSSRRGAPPPGAGEPAPPPPPPGACDHRPPGALVAKAGGTAGGMNLSSCRTGGFVFPGGRTMAEAAIHDDDILEPPARGAAEGLPEAGAP